MQKTASTAPSEQSPQQWQQHFAHALFQGQHSQLAQDLNIVEHQRQQRFGIYQNNVMHSLTESLGELYPVVKQLVGDVYFKGCAALYLRQHPPQQAAMVFFGQCFPDFLTHFLNDREHTQSLPYLADVAQLELYHHQAYHAEDTAAMMAADFATIDPSTFENSHWPLHPSVKLLDSRFPVFSIWQAHQGDNRPTEINLDQAEAVVIARCQYECLVFGVDPGTYRFYQALAEGLSIHKAAVYALEGGDFDLSSAIALGVQHGFFSKDTL